MQHEYLFDVKLFATIRMQARSRKEAMALLRSHIHLADVNFGAWPNGDPITAEVSIDGEIDVLEEDGEAI